MKFSEAMAALERGEKVRLVEWPKESFLQKEEGDSVVFFLPPHGWHLDRIVINRETLTKAWELYEEPKPKVKRWKWAYYDGTSDPKRWRETEAFFTEEEIRKMGFFVDPIKLEYTEREFPE